MATLKRLFCLREDNIKLGQVHFIVMPSIVHTHVHKLTKSAESTG